MSHFSEIKVDFSQKYEKELVAALEEKFGKGHVEIHPEGAALFGFQGDNRAHANQNSPDYAPPCHIIIRRKHVGASANDVGYRRTEDGKYVAYISDYDKGSTFQPKKQNEVAQSYAEKVSTKQLKAKGYTVKRQVQKDGTIKLIATRYA
jgi:hypothetical protein